MKKAVLFIIIMVLIAALAGCITINMPESGGNTDNGGGSETTVEPEPETEPAEFNLADGLKMTEEGPDKIIDTDWFTLRLGAGETWTYEIDSNNSITIYNIIARDSKTGGKLCSIEAFDEGDTSFTELPSYAKVGQTGGKIIIVQYPTDLQYDMNNAQAAEEYKVVEQQLNRIRDGGGESPLKLK